jgi:PAS domain S-box-containing protein
MVNDTAKYKAIFDVAPIPIWEEDFSEIKKYLVDKGLFGKPEAFISEYLKNNPCLIQECIEKLRIIDFNQACLELHHATSKEELTKNFHLLFTPEALGVIRMQIFAICAGETLFQTESKMKTMDGQSKTILFKWKAVPGFEDSLESVIITTQDISSQQNAIEKQKSIEAKLNEAQRIAKVGYWEQDLKNNTLYWSDEILNIWEMKADPSEYSFEKFRKSIHFDDLEEFDHKYEQSILGFSPLDVIHRIVTHLGNVKWVHQKGNINKDESGNPTIFSGTVQDITQAEQMKQGLKDLLKRYHFVTKATSEAIYDWDMESEKVIWGEGYRKVFGHRIDLIDHNFSNWENNIHPEDHPSLMKSLNAFLKSKKESWEGNYRFKKGNGTYTYVKDKAIAIRYKNGKPYRMVGAIQDVSEAIKASEELKSRSHFIHTTLDNIPIGIAVNEFDSGKATLMNKKFSEIYGWPEDDLKDINSFFEKVYPDPKYRQQIKGKILSDIQSGLPDEMSWKGIEITTKSGQKKIISAKNIPLYSQNLMISTVIDETERFAAESALKESNERFLLATQAVSDAIWDWDLTTGKLFWGTGYSTLFGYPQDSDFVGGSNWADSIHPDDWAKTRQSFLEAQNDPKVDRWSGEYRFKKFDGTYAFVKGRTLILRNENGAPIRLVGALQDISDQKKYEEALSKERNLLRTLIDNIPDFVYVKDLNSKHIVNNKANVELIGAQTEAETLGKSPFDFFPEPLANAFVLDDQQVLNSKEAMINREEVIVDRYGNKKWLSTSKVPLLDQNGNSIGLLGVSKDITLRKIREESLIKKTRLLETIAEVVKLLLSSENHEEVLPDCLELMGKAVEADRVYLFEHFTDTDSNKIFARQMLEWTNGKVSPQINNTDYKAVDLDDHPLFLQYISNNKPFIQLTKELDGITRKVLDEQDIKSILQIPIFVGNTLYGFIGFDDCTNERVWSHEEISFLKTLTSNLGSAIERKQNLDKLKGLNEKLQKSNVELAVSNKELEQFAYVASHDLQEPLRMISSFLGLIEKKYSASLDEKGKQYINFAVDGAVRMKHIILDLLEYSKVGRIPGNEEEIDLNEMVKSICQMVNPPTPENKSKKIHCENLPIIHSQKLQIHHVLQNLISNALKYHKEGIHPEVNIHALEHKKHWELVISDNGLGIDPIYHEKIFVIFQRLHTKKEFSGTGIGLAICKKIVESLGGKIWLESELGEGSSFHFTLPK